MRLAVWGHPASEFPEGKDGADDIRAWLGKLRDAGVEMYIPFVISGGTPVFESSLLGPPSRELLGPVMDIADGLDMEVHPIVGHGGVCPSFEPGEGVCVLAAKPGEEMPSWAGKWTSPAFEENNEFITGIAEEMLVDYGCHGIHMDAARFPNSAALNEHPPIEEPCRVARKVWLGKETLEPEDMALPGVIAQEIRMRESFVRSLAESLRALCDEHGVPLSLAGRARYLKDAVVEGQDWAQWAHDGLLDFVCPMSYNPCIDRFRRFVEEHTRILEGARTELFAGVGRQSSLGTLTPQGMIEQFEYLAEQGVGAACIFHARALTDEDLRLLGEFMARV